MQVIIALIVTPEGFPVAYEVLPGNTADKTTLPLPWQAVRAGVSVKLLPQDGELYVFAESRDRVHKERAMRQRQLKVLVKRLKQNCSR